MGVLGFVLVLLFSTLCPASFAIILMWKRERESSILSVFLLSYDSVGAQWVSGRVLDLRPSLRHCVVSLSKTHISLLSTGSSQEDPSRHN